MCLAEEIVDFLVEEIFGYMPGMVRWLALCLVVEMVTVCLAERVGCMPGIEDGWPGAWHRRWLARCLADKRAGCVRAIRFSS